MLLKWEIYHPLLDFRTLVALLAYQHPQPFFTAVICFICKTLSKWHLCCPPHPLPSVSQALAVFSHFYAGDKGQINDVNLNFHVFSCYWAEGPTVLERCELLCAN